jgi:hypothetical protein
MTLGAFIHVSGSGESMDSSKLLATSLLTVACLSGQPAGAHHSYAMFDMEKSITLEGTIKEVQWTNPHIWVQIMVKDPSGKEVEWSIEGASPNMLSRAGWTRKAVQAGDQATLVVFPVKVGAANGHSGSLSSATVNGKKVFGGQGSAKSEESK